METTSVDILTRKKYHDMFKDKLPEGVEIFYEIVGWINDEKTIMGRCSNKLIKDKEFSKQYGPETVFLMDAGKVKVTAMYTV